jgi:hypothetical protein
MTRRGFLAIAAATTAVIAGVWSIADRVRPESLFTHLRRFEGFGRAPADRLRAHYAWLNVDPQAFDEYLAAYQRVFGRLTRVSIPRSDFYTCFLLCTDFFPKRESQPESAVRYTGFYYPPESPCYNPIAQPPPTDAELAAANAGRRRS